MDIDYRSLIEVAEEAAVEAGAFCRQEFVRIGPRDHRSKGRNDFFTYVDVRAEEMIVETIRRFYPKHSIIGEETGASAGEDNAPTWHIDPVDGTNNYIRKIPFYAVSIGISHGGVPMAGVIYAPEQNELFRAADGQGAFLNKRRIRVAPCDGLSSATIAFGFPHRQQKQTDANLDRVRPVLARAGAVRRCGSAALDLAWLACGRFDGYVELSLQKHDIAAGIAIAREAGAFVSGASHDEDCFDTGNVIAGGENVHRDILKALPQ